MILREWHDRVVALSTPGCTVLCVVSCTKERWAVKPALFTTAFISLIFTTLDVVYHLLCSIPLSVSFRIKQTERKNTRDLSHESCTFHPRLSFRSLHWATPPPTSPLILYSSNTYFAPRCSVIAHMEFHFCSTGLWHILKGGLATATVNKKVWFLVYLFSFSGETFIKSQRLSSTNAYEGLLGYSTSIWTLDRLQ